MLPLQRNKKSSTMLPLQRNKSFNTSPLKKRPTFWAIHQAFSAQKHIEINCSIVCSRAIVWTSARESTLETLENYESQAHQLQYSVYRELQESLEALETSS